MNVPQLALDIVGTSQPGILYGESLTLTVRLHLVATNEPVPNATVRFSIFRDPVGSTLSSDRALTDAQGQASVTLTAGQAMATFVVAATATNAPEADFDVSVAKTINDFVELDVQLRWSGAAATTTLTALLYDQLRCAQLPAAATSPTAAREFSATATNMATLQLEHLLPADISIVGRAEDATSKRLVGYGCVDVNAGLLPAGTVSTLPLPLSPVTVTPAGSYTVTSLVTPATALTQPVLAPWRTLACSDYGLAQLLLDQMGVAQGAANANGCKTAMVDQQVQPILASTAAGAAMPMIYADLVQMLSGMTTLRSVLTVSAAGAAGLVGEHRLVDATLPGQAAIDLTALGLPVVDAGNIGLGFDGAKLSIGAHGFTLGWTTLWRLGLGASIASRAPSVPAPGLANLMKSVVGSNCTQIATVACKPPATCTAQSCLDAADAIDAAWQAPLGDPTTLDLAWRGSGTVVPGDTDLTVDQLVAGSWTSDMLANGTFSAMRTSSIP